MNITVSAEEGRVGQLLVTGVYETDIVAEAKDFLIGFDEAALAPHLSWLAPDHFDPASGEIRMPVRTWIVRDGRRTFLIDTCLGNHKDRRRVAGLHQLEIPWLERLAAAGVTPDGVDYVLCTHLHLDHVGWNTRLENGRWVPTFPNAKYVIAKAELDHFRAAEGPFDRLVWNDSVAPVVEAGQVEAVDGEDLIAGLLAIKPTPGHTPGHIRLELRSGGELGVFSGDILHSPVQAPFWRWSTTFCSNPDQSAETRRETLAYCASEGALLIPAHFHKTPVARVSEAGDGFGLRFGW
jgi:glyoxylase-like metal-dependent hydrolase (beta-lactamase superfamily II)